MEVGERISDFHVSGGPPVMNGRLKLPCRLHSAAHAWAQADLAIDFLTPEG